MTTTQMPKLDTSKILLYMRCPRRFFFEHILNKRAEAIYYHLTFGSAIHNGMEVLIQNQAESDKLSVLAKAMDAFDQIYLNQIPVDMYDIYPNKTRENAHRIFQEYVMYWHTDSFTPLYTEVSGEVHIGYNRTLMFKIDAIIKNHLDNKLWIMEHKTASRKTDEQWQAHIQPRVYLHVLNSLKSEVPVGGVVMNTLILRDPTTKVAKTREFINDFNREKIILSGEQMLTFLQTVNYWYSRIQADYEQYLEEKEQGEILTAFPQACTSCYDYFTLCPFNNICAYSAYNAAQEFNAMGFIDYEWNPLKEYKTLKV